MYKSTHTIKPGIKIISKVSKNGEKLKLEGNIKHVKTEIESLGIEDLFVQTQRKN